MVYDYDELALLSEVNFRKMPVSQSYEDEMLDQPWFPVEPNDVFPEEFRTYLRSPRVVGEVFDEVREICTVEFWQEMKYRHQGGERRLLPVSPAVPLPGGLMPLGVPQGRSRSSPGPPVVSAGHWSTMPLRSVCRWSPVTWWRRR